MSNIKRIVINLVFLAITLIINTLGAAGFIGGMSQKEVSDMYNTLITPVPSTFSIWGLIYALIIGSLIVLAIKRKDNYYGKALEKISLLFWITSILNILWIVSFSYLLIGLSTLFIAGLLGVLIIIDLELLHIHEKKRWLLPAAFGMYSGWLFIATVVNIAAALIQLKWNGFGLAPEIWASAILMIAVILVILVLLKLKNAVFPLPIAWAFWGIYNNSQLLESQYSFLRTVAIIGMILLVISSIAQFVKNRFSVIA